MIAQNRGDKSYLGNRSFRAQTNEPVEAKIFVEFVALTIRNRFHTYLKDCIIQTGKKQNYMNVPAEIRELEKIEIVMNFATVYTKNSELNLSFG